MDEAISGAGKNGGLLETPNNNAPGAPEPAAPPERGAPNVIVNVRSAPNTRAYRRLSDAVLAMAAEEPAA
jgi:hypothetical protein